MGRGKSPERPINCPSRGPGKLGWRKKKGEGSAINLNRWGGGKALQ